MFKMYNKVLFIFLAIFILISTTFCNAQQPRVLWKADLLNGKVLNDTEHYISLRPVICDVLEDSAPEIMTSLRYMSHSKAFLLNGRDGSIKWSHDLGGWMFNEISVIHDNGEDIKKLAIGVSDTLYLLSAETGKILKKINHGKRIYEIASADIDGDGVNDYAVVGDWLYLAVYNGRSGKRLWELNSEKQITTISIDDIDKDGSMEVISAYCLKRVDVMDALSGEREWAFDLGKVRVMGIFSAPVYGYALGVAELDGRKVLIIGTAIGDVVILDGKSGKKLQRKQIAEHLKSITNLSTGDLNGDGIFDIVVTSIDKSVYAVSGKGLEKLWEFETGDEVYSSPALGDMDNDGLLDVVVVSNDGRAYCIDGEDGKLIWKYDDIGYCKSGSAFLGDVNANGFVDVVISGAVKNDKLVVLETDARCEKNAVLWPKRNGNNRNTGQYGVR